MRSRTFYIALHSGHRITEGSSWASTQLASMQSLVHALL